MNEYHIGNFHLRIASSLSDLLGEDDSEDQIEETGVERIKAGSKLNALIAERVLGLERNKIKGFSPSTNDDHATVLAECMQIALNCSLSLETSFSALGIGKVARFKHPEIPKYEIFVARSAHSIALAALAAIKLLSAKRNSPVNIRMAWAHPEELPLEQYIKGRLSSLTSPISSIAPSHRE